MVSDLGSDKGQRLDRRPRTAHPEWPPEPNANAGTGQDERRSFRPSKALADLHRIAVPAPSGRSSELILRASPLLTIRPAVEGDIPALVRLLRRSWLVTWAPEVPFYAVQTFAALDPVPAVVAARWPIMWVATLGASLAGRVDVEGDRLENIEVDPALWRQGIGPKLLAHGENLIACSHAVAFLEVRAFNARAIRFYDRHGWKEVRRYPGTECGAPVENIEMSKSLLSRGIHPAPRPIV